MSARHRRMGRNDDTMAVSVGADDEGERGAVSYDEIIARGSSDQKNTTEAANALALRLQKFRQWLIEDAQATVHPAICIVNGEATDGTRNAPVLVFEIPSDVPRETVAGRLGVVDGEHHQSMYDRTMGCQIRTVREVKKDETIMTIPRAAMVTPDLVASSDAGRAVLACCKALHGGTACFWDTFGNTTECEAKLSSKIPRGNGPQTLMRILQERKKVEQAFKKHFDEIDFDSANNYTLAERDMISTRAPFLAFLIHQRFSNSELPFVSSCDFAAVTESNDGNALKSASPIQKPPNSPNTFAPYARTLPSTVSLPLCWKRNELALLSGCLPGVQLLHEVATKTAFLVHEFMTLLNAGLHKRFPDVFPRGILTWERWVWAAAVHTSRSLPASCYVDDGADILSWRPTDDASLLFQSPGEIWRELGVMIPFLDMLNHESEANQITWKPPSRSEGSSPVDEELATAPSDRGKSHLPRAVLHKKVRKGSEVFTNYGSWSNYHLLLQYGFALVNNSCDDVRMGWSLSDGVGNTDPPHDHNPSFDIGDDYVFESNDEKIIKPWWTEDRLELLKQEALSAVGDSFIQHLLGGGKMHAKAHNDGTYDPILLTAAVVATMPDASVKSCLSRPSGSNVAISRRHQVILKRYLQFWFSRKLEKLLQNLNSGLRDHYSGISLWTKSTNGGLEYSGGVEEGQGDNVGKIYTGWQQFFDSHAYAAAVEVEKHYYSVGVDSCVLTLYDGQLRALQTSVNGIEMEGELSDKLKGAFKDLNFDIAEDDDPMDSSTKPDAPITRKSSDSNGHHTKAKQAEQKQNTDNGSTSPKNRKRNKKDKKDTGNKPPALKLHVGNLSYKTTPSDLYDYFSSLYGEDNVLECHIPTERDSGRSRGFGFVAMPQEVAQKVLSSSKKHEVGGRVVKIAKSNSVGASGSNGKATEDIPSNPTNDRCVTCGYTPRYCTCPAAAAMRAGRGLSIERPGDYATPPQYPPPAMYPPPQRYDYQAPPPMEWYRDERDYRNPYYDYDRYGNYDRERRSKYGDSSSRASYERSEERWSRRDRERSSDSRSYRIDYEDERGRKSRRHDSQWDEDDRSKKRSRSRSRERDRNKKKKSKRRSHS